MATRIKGIDILIKRFPKEYPLQVANVYTNHFKQAFRKQGYYKGSIFIPWKSRKKKDVGRAILVKSGRLKKSIKRVLSSTSRIIITSNTPYSEKHNRGFKGVEYVKSHIRRAKIGKRRVTQVVKAHSRQANTPKRTFMNNNKVVIKQAVKVVKRLIRKALKN
jgi:phage gpG-like protein